MGSEAVLQENPPVPNWGCQLTLLTCIMAVNSCC